MTLLHITTISLLQGVEIFQGPRYLRKHKQPWAWSFGIIPPPFDVSMASNMVTTSSIPGRLSGLASQHRFITFARELGQQRGISGLRFWRTTADVTSEKLRSGYGISQQYISHKHMPKLYTSHFLLYGLPLRTCSIQDKLDACMFKIWKAIRLSTLSKAKPSTENGKHQSTLKLTIISRLIQKLSRNYLSFVPLQYNKEC